MNEVIKQRLLQILVEMKNLDTTDKELLIKEIARLEQEAEELVEQWMVAQ